MIILKTIIKIGDYPYLIDAPYGFYAGPYIGVGNSSFFLSIQLFRALIIFLQSNQKGETKRFNSVYLKPNLVYNKCIIL